jgi:hypothetical protein
VAGCLLSGAAIDPEQFARLTSEGYLHENIGRYLRVQAESLSAGYAVEAQVSAHPCAAVSGPNPITIDCRLI